MNRAAFPTFGAAPGTGMRRNPEYGHNSGNGRVRNAEHAAFGKWNKLPQPLYPDEKGTLACVPSFRPIR